MDDVSIGDPVEVLFFEMDMPPGWVGSSKPLPPPERVWRPAVWRPATVVRVGSGYIGVAFANHERMAVQNGGWRTSAR
jgi:hypothetical protein